MPSMPSCARPRGSPPVAAGAEQGRLIFALDATMSRQPTWDLACRVQAAMFETTARIGGLAVQLAYFRGFGECRASRWVSDARALTAMMTSIDCRGGLTQIERVLRHVRKAAGTRKIAAFILCRGRHGGGCRSALRARW